MISAIDAINTTTTSAEPRDSFHPTVAPPPLQNSTPAPAPDEKLGWSHPDLPVQNRFLTGLQDSSINARQAMAQEAKLTLPPNWQSMSYNQFITWATNSTTLDQGERDPQGTPLVIQAHSRLNGATHAPVAVKCVTVEECGDDQVQETVANRCHSDNLASTVENATAGHYYQIWTQWEDGGSDVQIVKDAGQPVDIF